MIIPALICGIVFTSCGSKINEEDGITIITDTNYPTTIYCLSEETLTQKRNDFAERNPTLVSTINQFGFCGWGEELINGAVSSGTFTEEEAIEAVMEFVAGNPETGVINLENLHFERITRGPNSNSWVLVTESQVINDIEVYKANIVFNVQNQALYFCTGHYFPNVYVPERFNFDIERAKSKLLGKEVIHWGWAGQYSLGKIKTEHFQGCTTNLIIVPLITEDKLELRVTWKIGVTLHYIYYVDVMTGEIIQEEPTIIA